ncbi:MAG TPA: CCA tRNA nucleotidyltransferase [Dehalococcoidales bacterium]|nr:CCA tRNA nucleotidyltransferase [Dehalococcoidales bacterium]
MRNDILKLARQRLPAGLNEIISQAVKLAGQRKESLYLVGGIVRDTLLNVPNYDVDLVTEGDAIVLATDLAEKTGGKLTTHEKFRTAKVKTDSWSIDMTTARSESYARPGALPTVGKGSLKEDLFRRDFTINAMALRLTPPHPGELIDFFGGEKDIRDTVIRILHDKSFADDATRIWRAIRYEQRLGFAMEEKTLKLLGKSLPYLRTVSGDRIRHELERVFQEEKPEKILRRATELKVLPAMNRALKADVWLQSKYIAARKTGKTGAAPEIYYALLAYRLKDEELASLLEYLKPAGTIKKVLRDSNRLKKTLEKLDDDGMANSEIYKILNGFSASAAITNALATSSPAVRKNLRVYLDELRYVKIKLTGSDLAALGIKQGPGMQTILNALLDARLDGKVKTRRDEERMALKIAKRFSG